QFLFSWHLVCFINRQSGVRPISSDSIGRSWQPNRMDLTVSAPRASQKNILIVDDEENLLLLLERILTRQGYHVVTAQNGYEACTQLETRVFQLAILDIKMFPLNGVFLLGEIKSRSPSTEVIMI